MQKRYKIQKPTKRLNYTVVANAENELVYSVKQLVSRVTSILIFAYNLHALYQIALRYTSICVSYNFLEGIIPYHK